MSRATFNRSSMRLVAAIERVFEEHQPPLTVRQVYYQLASSGLVPLSLVGYRQAQRLLLKVREEGRVPWEHFADRTRERILRNRWKSIAAFADVIGSCYRKDLWAEQEEHVEVWLEKDALSAFVEDVLDPYGVPLYVARGFASATFIHEAAMSLRRIDKPRFVYYLGDHDPSGVAIEQSLVRRLQDFGVVATFERIAINLDDIKAHDLRPLVAKKSDSRHAAYVKAHGSETIELDALPPTVLRERIVDAVDRHIDVAAWERLRRVERIEQDTIRTLADRMAA